MAKVKNIIPSIVGIGVLVAGGTLIRQHHMFKKKAGFKSISTEDSRKNSSNAKSIAFVKQRFYIKLSEDEDYMDLSELEATRDYIELGETNVKKKEL